MNRSLTLRASALLAALFIGGLSSTAYAELIYGIASGQGSYQTLMSWDSSNPDNIISALPISNLGSGSILGLDFRPADGRLWALISNQGFTNVGWITTDTASLVNVGGLGNDNVSGFNFGFDFNPTIDRLRITAETNKNLVVDPNTGALQLTATNLFYGPADPNFGRDPNVTQSAYTNSFPGAGSTQLYGIDAGLDILVTQANNAGTLGTVGPLGVNVGAYGGFDISGATGIAYAALTPVNSSVSNLYSINLLTGAATNLGQIDGGVFITAMAVQGIPEPATAGLALCAVAAGGALRRRSA